MLYNIISIYLRYRYLGVIYFILCDIVFSKFSHKNIYTLHINSIYRIIFIYTKEIKASTLLTCCGDIAYNTNKNNSTGYIIVCYEKYYIYLYKDDDDDDDGRYMSNEPHFTWNKSSE